MGSDPRLEWSAPGDGIYIAAVEIFCQRGGEGPGTARSGQAESHREADGVREAFTVIPRKTNEIKVTMARSGDSMRRSRSLSADSRSVACEPVLVEGCCSRGNPEAGGPRRCSAVSRTDPHPAPRRNRRSGTSGRYGSGQRR